ncbi:hypothetical protein [Bacteroides coprosuis]|uniref:hypothetical protein n=1 Tax=Bacteroides coprosuis TaxID=151276 RepID=UPI001E0FB642|nr:hypothetical protein [Bacteroides coprosuis]HJD93227.1 hypothetical protein [Bacteroides coprosuis]
MRRLYLFNPESDLALANNDENYMPPQSARKLAKDLALLPLWYAEKDSLILAESYPNTEYLEWIQSILPIKVDLLTYPEASHLSDIQLSPWGWNKAINKFFKQLGLNTYCPTDDYLSALRHLTRRDMAARLLKHLPKYDFICGSSQILMSKPDLESFHSVNDSFILKAPISGSGKGLKWCRRGLDEAALKWFNRTIAQQDSAIGEPIYSKELDFAMEFEIISSSEIHFIGYSSFETNANGAYIGNKLISDVSFLEDIERKYGLKKALLQIQRDIEKLVLQFYGTDYRGCLGVDMMVCQFESYPCFRIHPCVEVNLRMNMGILAHQLYHRYIDCNSTGIYKIDYSKKMDVLYQQHLRMQKKYPLVIKEGKIVEGYLALCPVTRQSQYHAWILIE